MEVAADFEQFFLNNYDRTIRTITAMTGDPQGAQDSAQEAFVKAAQRWSRVRRYENPRAWVLSVAINKSRDSHRSSLRRRRREERDWDRVPVEGSDPTPAVDSHLRLAGLLAALPPMQRKVTALFYVEDMSVADIADLLGLSTGAVKFHLNKARAGLRRHLGDRGASHV